MRRPCGLINSDTEPQGTALRSLSRVGFAEGPRPGKAGEDFVTALRDRPFDAFLVFWFALFAVSSLVFEPFIVFDVDLASTTDVVGRTWYWYASSFDPVFLETPVWLRIMCGIDAFLFGPFYLVLIHALVRARNWIRTPALLYGAAVVYSTAVYFGYEVLDPGNRAQANLPMVFLVNLPFTVVPLLLLWRMRCTRPFAARPASDSLPPSKRAAES